MENQTLSKIKPKWLSSLQKVESIIARIVGWIATITFMVVITSIFLQVIGRYFFSIPTPWAEELARYMWLPAVLLGCAYATFIDHHIEINLTHIFIKRAKTDAGKRKVAAACYYYRFIMILIISGLYVFLTWEYFNKVFAIQQVGASTHIPIWIFVLGMLIGFILTVVHALIKLIAARYDLDYKDLMEETYDEINMEELKKVENTLKYEKTVSTQGGEKE